MEVIVAKRCSCCTRVLPVERFRLRIKDGKQIRYQQCKQCEQGREAMRWKLTKEQRSKWPDRPRDDRMLTDQLCDVQLSKWRYPVERGPLVARIYA